MTTLTRPAESPVNPPPAAPVASDATPPTPLRGAAAATGGRARAFRFAWAAYLFLHHTMVYYAWFQFKDKAELVVGTLLWVIGGLALLRAVPLGWFVALLVAHLAYELPALPRTANHTFLTICINVTMLAAIAAAAVRSRGRALLRDTEDGDPLYARMFALLRLEVLFMYFFVVLHKLNRDYFDPAYSCATQLYREIVQMYPLLPAGAWTDPLCIYGAIGAEAAIPLLLLFRRTRLAGIGLGLLFHFILSPHPNRFIYSFSSMLYAAYFLFMPHHVLKEVVATWSRLLSRLRRRWAWFALIVVSAAATIVLMRLFAKEFVRQTGLIDHAHVYIAALIRFGFNAAALFMVYAFARAVWVCRARAWRSADPPPGAAAEPFFRPALSPLLVFPLLVLFNGFCPYLGLKTESAFAMYANLRTEGSVNNHLFMPRVALAGYQDDLVEIVGSSDRELRNLKRDGYAWTYYEFRRKLARVRSDRFWVAFTRNGGPERTLRYAEHKSDPAFARLPWYERRLLFFRDVQLGSSPQHCGH